MTKEQYIEGIERMRKQKNAIILAHYYTLPEVQEIADFVGDSLALARKAASTDASIILFAGVHFMAETAKILNPDKKVLVPDMSAGCCLADGCRAADLARFKEEHPDYLVLSYVNCTAAVKALSDLIVTSGNALRLVNTLPADAKILFTPDQNLGDYINRQTGRQMLLWDGMCRIHDHYTIEDLELLKESYPGVKIVAHPECRREFLEHADFVGSTAAMIKFISESEDQAFIVATESGILHELKKRNPNKTFYTLYNGDLAHDCGSMKKNNLENIYQALLNEEPELLIEPELMKKALAPIQKMLDLS
ncbi:MAG: quinolinate synthase NadA [Bacteroidales bacterium]|nr:quinolinate synthase NadA [Bacteroidales bacterium]